MRSAQQKGSTARHTKSDFTTELFLRGKVATSVIVFAYKRLYGTELHQLGSNRGQLGPTWLLGETVFCQNVVLCC